MTLLVLTARRKLRGPGAIPPHPGEMAFDMQSPAPCQDLAISELLLGSSCLCPQLHIIPAWQGWRTNDAANPSLTFKPISSNAGIPLVHGGHSEGTSSLVTTLWCVAPQKYLVPILDTRLDSSWL